MSKEIKELDVIKPEDVKNGQFVQLDDGKLYVIVKHNGYKLIPIILKDSRSFYDNDKILIVFEAKNGNVVSRLKEVIK